MFSLGFWTLLRKETKRFLKVPGQTLGAPLVTTLLYFLVFGLSIGNQLRQVHGVPYIRFIVPGLVIMPVITNSFLNTSSSIFVGKMQGTIIDLLLAPLGYGEVLVAYLVAATLRSLMVAALVYLVAGFFTTFELVHPAWVITFAIVTAIGFAALGLCVAIASDKFEQLNIIPTFVITPLSFLGGVFYSLEFLPPTWQAIARANPILYMVDGLRYGFIGSSDVAPWVGLAVLAVFVGGAVSVAYWMLRSGYKLRG